MNELNQRPDSFAVEEITAVPEIPEQRVPELTADAFAASGKLVEVNTGGISRGWIDDAYPSPFFRQLLRARGVRFILSSDAHSAAAIDCAFDRFGAAENYIDSPIP